MLSEKEKKIYNRQLLLPNFSEKEQVKLKHSKVLVVGAGGLGAVVLTYLSRSGVGNIGIIEFDTVDETNLHRQVLYNDADVGKSKPELALVRLKAGNPNINYEIFEEALSEENIAAIFDGYEIIVDCTDNFKTRYLINDYACANNKVVVFGSVAEFEGQVTVLNAENKINYRNLFPDMPTGEPVKGVLPTLVSIIGGLQANEVIKLISGIGEALDGKLLTYNILDNSQYILSI